MKDFLSKYKTNIINFLVGVGVSLALGAAFYNILEFLNVVGASFALFIIYWAYLYNKEVFKNKDEEIGQWRKSMDEMVAVLENDKIELEEMKKALEASDALSEEMEGVITEYEKIFDSQLVKLPCLCGGNTFEGLFSPNTDNIVECEKCKNKYRVEIDYNSILISEPLDLEKPFTQSVGTIDN